MKNVTFKNVICIIVLVILTLFAYGYYEKVQNVKDKYEQTLKIIEGKDKAIEINESLLKDLTSKNKELKEQVKEFKDVKSITKTVTKVIIDTVFIEPDSTHVDTITGNFYGRFATTTIYYSIDGNYSNKGFRLNSLEIPNEQTIVIGDKKIKGFLGITKGTEFTIDIKNSNPYVNTINVQNYTIKKTKKWYEKPTFLIGVGIVGGVLLAK
jgi:hypothetical protein